MAGIAQESVIKGVFYKPGSILGWEENGEFIGELVVDDITLDWKFTNSAK